MADRDDIEQTEDDELAGLMQEEETPEPEEHEEDEGEPEVRAEAEEEGAEDEGEEGEDKSVPLARLLQERKRFQTDLEAARQDAMTLRGQVEHLSGIGEELRQWREEQKAEKEARAAEAQKGAEPEEPDFMTDPEGFARFQAEKAKREALAEAKAEIDALKQEGAQTQEQNAALIQAREQLSVNDQKFAADHPDYYQALDHLRNIHMQNAMLFGATEAEARVQIGQAELQGAIQLLSAGKDPAEAYYEMAKRFGYTSAKKGDEAGDEGEEDDLSRQRKRNRAGSAGSSGLPAALDELVDMEDSEFDEAMGALLGQGNPV